MVIPQRDPRPLFRRCDEPRRDGVAGDVCDLVENVFLRGELYDATRLCGPEVLALILRVVECFRTRSMELAKKDRERSVWVGDDEVVMVGHHASGVKNHACLRECECEAVLENESRLVRRTKSEGALEAATRDEVTRSSDDSTRESHARAGSMGCARSGGRFFSRVSRRIVSSIDVRDSGDGGRGRSAIWDAAARGPARRRCTVSAP